MVVTGIAILTLISWLIYMEWMQLKGYENYREYFYSIKNVSDLFQISSTLLIVLVRLFNISKFTYHGLRLIATFSIFLLWAKLFDWLRLFEPTSFYYKLVKSTFLDIKEFMILFSVALCMIGSAMYILEMDSEKSDDHEIIESFTGFFLLDSMYNQYVLSLGPAPDEFFKVHKTAVLLNLFFIFSSFFLTIVFLNMLIAIMGNTFSFVIERKQ